MGINNIEQDITDFFNDTECMGISDQKQSLRLLLEKYTHVNKADHVMDIHDLRTILSSAKTSFVTKAMPVYLGRKTILLTEDEQRHICIIESTIGHINKLDCLKRLPKFDYSDNKS